MAGTWPSQSMKARQGWVGDFAVWPIKFESTPNAEREASPRLWIEFWRYFSHAILDVMRDIP
ncbi:MAG: hypothetical protein ACK5QX_06210, partial [bacterium]